MKSKPIIITLLILSLAAGGFYFFKNHRMDSHAGHAHAEEGKYLCPMHPEVVQDKPGECPICGMDLVFTKSEKKKSMSKDMGGDTYICPMHPEVVQDKPGSCPICGMDLVLKKSERKNAGSGNKGKILFYRHPMQPDVTSPTPQKDNMGMDYIPVYSEDGQGSGVVEGRALTGLSLNQQQLIGVKTEPIKVRSLVKTIFTYGRVAYDPDLYNAQEEYLAALDIEKSSSMNPLDQSNSRGQKLLESARTRLQLLGLSNAQINDLENSRRVDSRLLLAPAGNQKSWIYADIYENDLSSVKPGQMAEVTSNAFPGEIFEGEVIAIDPVLNPKTRTVRARVEVNDPKSQLKPEVFVDVLIQVAMGKGLSVPASAVLDSGRFKLVFVDLGEGNFEPRKVIVGKKAEGYFEIKDGLMEGEKVVSNGNFLLDAESQLRGATAGMTFYKGKEAAE